MILLRMRWNLQEDLNFEEFDNELNLFDDSFKYALTFKFKQLTFRSFVDSSLEI